MTPAATSRWASRSRKAASGVEADIGVDEEEVGEARSWPRKTATQVVAAAGHQADVAMNAAMRLATNVQLNGGVAWGLNEDVAGGRVGVRVGW